jgi:hypothetical protein
LDLEKTTAGLRLCRCFFADNFFGVVEGCFAGVFAKNVVQMVVF